MAKGNKSNTREQLAKRLRRHWQLLLLIVLSTFFAGTLSLFISKTYSKSQLEDHDYPSTTEHYQNSNSPPQLFKYKYTPDELHILNAEYFLIDLPRIQELPANGKMNYKITGEFCPLDWNLQKNNPSTVPMFRDLLAQSKDCEANSIRMDLRTMAQKARHYDLTHTTTSTSTSISTLALSGVVFHETRCGSTLVANLLASANSATHRVYSESGPPMAALQLCNGIPPDDNITCNTAAQDAVLQDVIYLMSRSNVHEEQHVFFKIQSIGVHNIHVMNRVFPSVPWIFVYRETVEILMSHLKTKDQTHAVCLRAQRSAGSTPSIFLKKAIQGRHVHTLSSVEFCAAHVASLCLAALKAAAVSSVGSFKFVPYSSLPDSMWESLLPNHFHIEDINVKAMKQVANVYSKGRGHKANVIWKSDSQYKNSKAWEEMKQAANVFVKETYEKMQELSDLL